MTDEQMELDGFELDEGSIFDDFTGTLVDAYFGTDARIDNGQTLLLITTFESPELDKPNVVMFSCGKGWKQEDNGARAVREDGAKKNFTKNSSIGLFIQNALKVGAGPAMKKNGGSQFNAASYIGLKLHMKATEIDYGKEIGKKKKLVPVEFLGVDGELAAGGASGGATNAKPATSTKAADDSPLMEAVKSIAAEAASHEEFMEKAFAIPGVEDDTKLAAAVMSTKPGSIWSVAQANK